MKQDNPLIRGDKSDFFHCEYCEKMFAIIAGRKNNYKMKHKDIINPPAQSLIQGQPGNEGTE